MVNNTQQPQTENKPYVKPDFKTIDLNMEAPLLSASDPTKQYSKHFG